MTPKNKTQTCSNLTECVRVCVCVCVCVCVDDKLRLSAFVDTDGMCLFI